MFGKILNHAVNGNTINIQFETGIARIEIIRPTIINIFSPLKYDDHYSRAIENLKPVSCNIKVENKGSHLKITTEALITKIYNDLKVDFFDINGRLLCEDYRGERELLLRRGDVSTMKEEGHKIQEDSQRHKIEIIKKMSGDEKFYGFGEKTGFLNKKGYYYEMWNTDDPSPHDESFPSLYKSVPFFITLRDNCVFGMFFDNTFKSYFDMGKENSQYYYFGADDGNLDYYFISGNNIKDVVSSYTGLTGRAPLPQMWTLGFHQCRWSYTPAERVREIAENFRENDIPCDSIQLDIDYMDSFKVFTWNNERFPDRKEFIKSLNNSGFKIVTIIDPGVKKEKGYEIYETGLKNGYYATDKDGVTYVNRVWPGDSVYPDFSSEATRNWWADNQKIMLDSGVSGIWNDMNEPASFNGPLPDDVQFKNEGRNSDHTEVHNVYGHLMSKATYEGLKKYSGKRPFVITRACYAGSQKYAVVWTGDNQSFWEHLRMAVPQLLNMGLSGLSIAGTDVGGFGSECTAELLSRWVQVGCFSPLFRNHTRKYSRDQEPWAYDEETLRINKKYINLRYKLIPYIYDLLWSGEETGLSVLRPLVMHYQKDVNVHEMNDAFMVGENILVAPVVEQGKRARAVYLPEGLWTDYWTKEVITGSRYIIKETPLDTCPIYIKAGSILPNYPKMNYIGEVDVTELTLDVYPGNGSYVHYVDDKESFNYRDGEYDAYEFRMSVGVAGALSVTDHFDNNVSILPATLEICKIHAGYKGYDSFRIIFNRDNVNEIIFNEEKIKFSNDNGAVVFNVPPINGRIIIK